MGDIGWIALADANTYFSTRRLESANWDALTAATGGKDEKSAVLYQAYDRIRRSKEFTIPASPTAAELLLLKDAQCELAYYLATHGADEDNRKGLQAQGVVTAGVVHESYAEAHLNKSAFPPIVYDILNSMKNNTPFYAVDIDRDEDYSADEDVTDTL
jgi:hypothetical protein